jgi:hypothetical protein
MKHAKVRTIALDYLGTLLKFKLTKKLNLILTGFY